MEELSEIGKEMEIIVTLSDAIATAQKLWRLEGLRQDHSAALPSQYHIRGEKGRVFVNDRLLDFFQEKRRTDSGRHYWVTATGEDLRGDPLRCPVDINLFAVLICCGFAEVQNTLRKRKPLIGYGTTLLVMDGGFSSEGGHGRSVWKVPIAYQKGGVWRGELVLYDSANDRHFADAYLAPVFRRKK